MRRIFLVFAAVICLCGIIAAGVAAMGIQPSTVSGSQKMEGAAKSAVSVLQDTEETKVTTILAAAHMWMPMQMGSATIAGTVAIMWMPMQTGSVTIAVPAAGM